MVNCGPKEWSSQLHVELWQSFECIMYLSIKQMAPVRLVLVREGIACDL